MKIKYKAFGFLALMTVALFASERAYAQSSLGYYNGQGAGFYLGHFDRSPDLAGYLGKFNGNLYRGGQPNIKMAKVWLDKLKLNNIKLVVDLRNEAEGLVEEQKGLKASQISYILLPWRTEDADQSPVMRVIKNLFDNGNYTSSVENLDKISASLEVIKIAKEYLARGDHIYVHCQRGEDRSGTFISLLRDLDDDWEKEFNNYGGTLYPSLKKHREDLLPYLENQLL